MPEPSPKKGKWKDVKDLKKEIDDYYRDNKPQPGNYIALIVEVTNPISGYIIVQRPTG